MRTPLILALPALTAATAVSFAAPGTVAAQEGRLSLPASRQTVFVTPTSGARPRPTSIQQRAELLGRLAENQRLDAKALAEPVRLRPSQPNHADRVYASLRTGTTIAGPTTDEAWVLSLGSTGLPSSGTPRGSWGTFLSGETPLNELFGTPRLTLTIKGAALKSKALVECGFRAEADGPLTLGGTIPAQTTTLKSGSGHLNVVVEPAASGQNVELYFEHTQNTPPVAFTYCEITALK